MHGLVDIDDHHEARDCGVSDCDRGRTKIHHVNLPGIAVVVSTGRFHGKKDDCGTVAELEKLAAETRFDLGGMGSEVHYGFALQRIHLARKERQAGKNLVHRRSILRERVGSQGH